MPKKHSSAALSSHCLCTCRPLIVIGKGAAQSQADAQLRKLVEATGIPFLATAMGRGVVPDNHPQNVNAARSLALAKADVALIVGARWAGVRTCERSFCRPAP